MGPRSSLLLEYSKEDKAFGFGPPDALQNPCNRKAVTKVFEGLSGGRELRDEIGRALSRPFVRKPLSNIPYLSPVFNTGESYGYQLSTLRPYGS